MAQLNKVSIPVAAAKKCKLDLSCDHTTTMSFMQMQPVYYRHMLKGEHLNFDCLATIRCAPMPVPTFGRMRLNLRGFAIPYRLAFPQWHSFYDDVIGSNMTNSDLVDSPPFFQSDALNDMFFTGTFAPFLSVAGTSLDYEFKIGANYYKLTYLGRRYLKVLESLGYKVIPSAKYAFKYNALALLSYAKIYVDWYSNAQYLNSSDVLWVQRLLAYNDPTNPKELDGDDIFYILRLTNFVVYDDNGYFTSAWDNPVAPNNGQFTNFGFDDPTSANGVVVSLNSMSSPEMFQSAATRNSLGTQYIHDALKRLTDYQKRHALAGARSIDRVLSQYGLQVDYLRTQRSIYVGSQSIDINVGDIYATGAGSNGSDTSSVGDFAGRGGGQGSKAWDYTTDEECIFIVIASVIPSGGYYQGYDRINKHIDKKDFFNPEFDGLGVQVVEKGEVFVSRDDVFIAPGHEYDTVFGYNGRYGEYKRPRNFVTGDFVFPTIMAGGSSWHLNREFNDGQFGDTQGLCHSLDFTRASDQIGYNRIFDYIGFDVDKFYCNFHFNVGAYTPCRPLTETYDFEEEGKSVTLDSNGTTLN